MTDTNFDSLFDRNLFETILDRSNHSTESFFDIDNSYTNFDMPHISKATYDVRELPSEEPTNPNYNEENQAPINCW